MDDEQFDSFVQFARSRLSRPELFMKSTAAEGRARTYLLLHRNDEEGADFLARLIGESQRDKSSWDALILIGRTLIEEGAPLTNGLAEWTTDVLNDQMARRGSKRRPRPSKGNHVTAGRDWNIFHLIDLLHRKWNLTPTRNEVSEPFSGCDVVAEAAELPYGTVARIWTTCSQHMRKS